MTKKWVLGLMIVLTACAPLAADMEVPIDAFEQILGDYEAIRVALLGDSIEGVAEHARAIETRTLELAGDFDAATAGVPPERAEECKALLPELAATAGAIAELGEIMSIREQFFELSKPLGRYRKLAGIEGSMVVACPMAKKAWIQPEVAIGNPYFGQQMPACGSRVAD